MLLANTTVMTSSPTPSATSYSHSIIPRFNTFKWRRQYYHHQQQQQQRTVSCSSRRHLRRGRYRYRHPVDPSPAEHSSSPSDQDLQVIVDVNNLRSKVSLSMEKLIFTSKFKFNQFIHSGTEAIEDLQTLITIDRDRRVVVSCRRATVNFFGNLVICGLVMLVAFRILIKIFLGFRSRFSWLGYGQPLILRRDRSLGGKEVIVGVKNKAKKSNEVKPLKNPLSPGWGSLGGLEAVTRNWGWGKTEEKLPSWWPLSHPTPFVMVNKEEYGGIANRFMQAILDNRARGRDISHADVIHLRRICRVYGVSVYIDLANARDSFYRASVDFVLNVCASAPIDSTSVEIDGEDARQFIAGLADNIELDSIRAARMVSAAVAARTRSCFLQAWALEVQHEHSESLLELSKICLILRIFTPEQCSPEMEMVARGLENILNSEQREFLLNRLIDLCGQNTPGSVAEALGLNFPNVEQGRRREQ